MKALWEPLGNNHFSSKNQASGQAAGRRLISGATGLMVSHGPVALLYLWSFGSVSQFPTSVQRCRSEEGRGRDHLRSWMSIAQAQHNCVMEKASFGEMECKATHIYVFKLTEKKSRRKHSKSYMIQVPERLPEQDSICPRIKVSN